MTSNDSPNLFTTVKTAFSCVESDVFLHGGTLTMQLLTARVETLSRRCQDRKLSKWITNEVVCELLRISPRSLQELRYKHRISYAQIGRKFYYRPEEVELVLRQSGTYINKVV